MILEKKNCNGGGMLYRYYIGSNESISGWLIFLDEKDRLELAEFNVVYKDFSSLVSGDFNFSSSSSLGNEGLGRGTLARTCSATTTPSFSFYHV